MNHLLEPLDNPITFQAFRHVALTQPLDQINKYFDDDGEEVDLSDTYAGDSESEDGSGSESEIEERTDHSELSRIDMADGWNSEDEDDTTQITDNTTYTAEHQQHNNSTDVGSNYIQPQLEPDNSPPGPDLWLAEEDEELDSDSASIPSTVAPSYNRSRSSAPSPSPSPQRFPERRGRQKPVPPHTSKPTEDDLEMITDNTLRSLSSLSMSFQPMLERQPLSTTTILCHQTAQIFARYAQHGSEARLSESLFQFLTAGDRVREVNNEQAQPTQVGIPQRREGLLRFEYATDHDKDESVKSKPKSVLKRPASDTLENQRIKTVRFEGSVAGNPYLDKTIIFAQTNSSTESPPPPSATTSANPSHGSIAEQRTYTTDEETNTQLADMPFHPIGLKFSWPEDLHWPAGLLDNINRILKLYDAEANFLLSYLERKYTFSTSSTSEEAPHALFRLAIATHLTHEVETLMTPQSSHFLSLTPETRILFREAWRHNAAINPLEEHLLARAANVDRDTVRAFWEDGVHRTCAWGVLRILIGMWEGERVRKAMQDGRW